MDLPSVISLLITKYSQIWREREREIRKSQKETLKNLAVQDNNYLFLVRKQHLPIPISS
jgi:hypothetical protein